MDSSKTRPIKNLGAVLTLELLSSLFHLSPLQDQLQLLYVRYDRIVAFKITSVFEYLVSFFELMLPMKLLPPEPALSLPKMAGCFWFGLVKAAIPLAGIPFGLPPLPKPPCCLPPRGRWVGMGGSPGRTAGAPKTGLPPLEPPVEGHSNSELVDSVSVAAKPCGWSERH